MDGIQVRNLTCESIRSLLLATAESQRSSVLQSLLHNSFLSDVQLTAIVDTLGFDAILPYLSVRAKARAQTQFIGQCGSDPAFTTAQIETAVGFLDASLLPVIMRKLMVLAPHHQDALQMLLMLPLTPAETAEVCNDCLLYFRAKFHSRQFTPAELECMNEYDRLRPFVNLYEVHTKSN
jgi:hypothetical protein